LSFHSPDEAASLFARLGIVPPGGDLVSRSPIDGGAIGAVASASPADVGAAVERAHQAYTAWRDVPAPRRGELVRLFGEVLREEVVLTNRVICDS
jgi:aldehyde dehydrogenase (NAD+)